MKATKQRPVVVGLQACFVCGCRQNANFLQQWNGKAVCRQCIRELNEEAERVE
ncbi:hypothetical protein [Paenibacillus sp. GCM10027626]|uniref:hypothetical protein n=1 Tax=Paenibacillus sp. GCM10027626 TaxID=3273411 RepID=UPI00362661C4